MNMNTVHYAEARGEHAGTALRAFLQAIAVLPGFLGAELLSSPEQPGLYLVASRWSGPVPPLNVPEGARAWTFTVLDAR